MALSTKGTATGPVQQEYIDGIACSASGHFAANKGKKRRSLNSSLYIMSFLLALYLRRPDVLIATSPQFFCAGRGARRGRFSACRFILEVRDIWPESIRAVERASASPDLAA